jgi:hypothetical protein
LKTTTISALLLMSFGAVALWACTESGAATAPPTSPPDEVTEPDAGPDPATSDSGTRADADSGLTGKCADTFGDKLTEGFGRIDGVVYAVQKPSDTQCTFPNDDHVIVQVLMNGAVYRLVTNVLSNGADSKVRFAEVPHALPAPAFAEGWHEGVDLDYPTTLDAHDDDFTPYSMEDLVTKIVEEVKVGSSISVYGTSGKGRPESAHLIHRGSNQEDGAIVVDPTGSPKFLLFHFPNQNF